MTKRQRLAAIRRASKALRSAQRDLKSLQPRLPLECDRWALGRTLTDLIWAIETCRVWRLHEDGRNLSDDHGFYCPAAMRAKYPSLSSRRFLPKAKSIAEANRRQLRSHSS